LLKFNTRAVHGRSGKQDIHGAIKEPIYSGAAFAFESAEDLEAAFAGRKPAHVYSRITNPTVEAFEQKMTALEDALASIAVASGMAAIANVFLSLLLPGENIVSAASLFGGTYSLFFRTLAPLGIETRLVDITNLESLRQAIDDKTKVIFFETIANPKMDVPDMEAIVSLAREFGILVVVDSTVTTPYLFRAKEFGVNVVVHSSTKFISGGGTSIGGVIVDLGNYDWTRFSALARYHKFGEWAFISRLRKEVYRDLGACLSPYHAYLQSVGLESLSLRVDRCCANTLSLAEFIRSQKQVRQVRYPGLPDSPFYALAKKQYQDRFGAILVFELESKAQCYAFLNRLKIIRRATNLGDNVTLAVHPASTIFVEYTDAEKSALGVNDQLIRLSVGLEDAEDLIADIAQALER
jgi:O-acetylhomoserine (thiol)-lyase